MRRNSILNDSFEILPDAWVISLINTGRGTTGTLMGHEVILIEGLDEEDNLFIRQCDIRAIKDNANPYISAVNIFESYHTDPNYYSALSSRSWYVSPESARCMLDAIIDDQQQTEEADRGQNAYLPFALKGRYSIFSNGANNCASWSIEKLEVAGIHIDRAPLDNFKLKPKKHVKALASTTESTTEPTTCTIS